MKVKKRINSITEIFTHVANLNCYEPTVTCVKTFVCPRNEIICSKLSNLFAHVSGVCISASDSRTVRYSSPVSPRLSWRRPVHRDALDTHDRPILVGGSERLRRAAERQRRLVTGVVRCSISHGVQAIPADKANRSR